MAYEKIQRYEFVLEFEQKCRPTLLLVELVRIGLFTQLNSVCVVILAP